MVFKTLFSSVTPPPLLSVQHNDVNRGMDINVTGVWERNITGQGVTVVVVDDGLEHTHQDIHLNYVSLNSENSFSDGQKQKNCLPGLIFGEHQIMWIHGNRVCNSVDFTLPSLKSAVVSVILGIDCICLCWLFLEKQTKQKDQQTNVGKSQICLVCFLTMTAVGMSPTTLKKKLFWNVSSTSLVTTSGSYLISGWTCLV